MGNQLKGSQPGDSDRRAAITRAQQAEAIRQQQEAQAQARVERENKKAVKRRIKAEKAKHRKG